MHDAAREYIQLMLPEDVNTVLEVGGRDINGGLRDLLPEAKWCSVDLYEGPGVDVVADFCDYVHPDKVDLVICAEVFEHTPKWPLIIKQAALNLKPEGSFIITTATGRRKPHSAIDGGELREGEHYANIEPNDLKNELLPYFYRVHINLKGADVRATGAWPK
jgi:SAM-dependent methyltransferase